MSDPNAAGRPRERTAQQSPHGMPAFYADALDQSTESGDARAVGEFVLVRGAIEFVLDGPEDRPLMLDVRRVLGAPERIRCYIDCADRCCVTLRGTRGRIVRVGIDAPRWIVEQAIDEARR